MDPSEFDAETKPDLIYFAGQRWGYVYRRAQHLMSRAARDYRVFFIEEAQISVEATAPRLEVTRRPNGVRVVVPQLPAGLIGTARDATMRLLLTDLFGKYHVQQYIFWYDTPAALSFTRHLTPLTTAYDCLDQPPEAGKASRTLQEYEAELLRNAGLLLAGGPSLYEVRRGQHSNVVMAPSAVDVAHFSQARAWQPEPADQMDIPHPRLGFLGRLDERLDWDLIEALADARPDWHLIFVDPDRAIPRRSLPARPNLHYLGRKPYADLPAYLASWDVGILPLAVNEATRFINPPELSAYLAAGKQVVATALPDVLRAHGSTGLVHIASTPADFIAAVETTLAREEPGSWDRPDWLRRVDEHLRTQSWETTWYTIARWLESEINQQRAPAMARARIAQAHWGELLFSEIVLKDEQ